MGVSIMSKDYNWMDYELIADKYNKWEYVL